MQRCAVGIGAAEEPQSYDYGATSQESVGLACNDRTIFGGTPLRAGMELRHVFRDLFIKLYSRYQTPMFQPGALCIRTGQKCRRYTNPQAQDTSRSPNHKRHDVQDQISIDMSVNQICVSPCRAHTRRVRRQDERRRPGYDLTNLLYTHLPNCTDRTSTILVTRSAT